MINEEWNKTQNDAPFVAFNDMHAVTFVLPDKMADVLIAGLQWIILIPRLNHTGSERPSDSNSKPYLHREKNYRIWNKNHPTCCNDIGTKEKVLQQGIHMWNMKAISPTIQKLWPMLNFFCRQKDGQTNKQTGRQTGRAKTIGPHIDRLV